MKVAAYVRASTEKQTTENQLPAIKALCKSRGWQLVKVYAEDESAWRAGRQSEFKRCVQDAKHNHFEMIICWALDRVSREGPLKVLATVDHLRKSGIKLISCKEPWTESGDSFTSVLFAITAWVAQYESDRRSERTKAGIAEKRLHGGGRRGKDRKRRKRRWLKRPQISMLEF
jgi:DNA invertase Pin-like site-specific DNA recombinase